ARHPLPRSAAASLLALLAVAAAAAGGAARPGPVRLGIGAFEGGMLRGPWGSPTRADLDPQAAADGRTQFYFRPARPGCALSLPLAVRGPGRLAFRARATVRSA